MDGLLALVASFALMGTETDTPAPLFLDNLPAEAIENIIERLTMEDVVNIVTAGSGRKNNSTWTPTVEIIKKYVKDKNLVAWRRALLERYHLQSVRPLFGRFNIDFREYWATTQNMLGHLMHSYTVKPEPGRVVYATRRPIWGLIPHQAFEFGAEGLVSRTTGRIDAIKISSQKIVSEKPSTLPTPSYRDMFEPSYEGFLISLDMELLNTSADPKASVFSISNLELCVGTNETTQPLRFRPGFDRTHEFFRSILKASIVQTFMEFYSMYSLGYDRKRPRVSDTVLDRMKIAMDSALLNLGRILEDIDGRDGLNTDENSDLDNSVPFANLRMKFYAYEGLVRGGDITLGKLSDIVKSPKNR